jgi:triosephosphate isomerase
MAPKSGAAKSGIRPLVAGNWKMNGLAASLGEARRVREKLGEPDFAAGVDAMICPPATLLTALAREAEGSRLLVGAQDCHRAASGAHTGDISADMLKDAGAAAVIVGHSERRADHGERSGDVQAKASAAHRAGLTAIVCIGETAGERKAGLTLAVVARQLGASLPEPATAANTVIAYEPVWAIGTGLTPSTADVAEVHGHLRRALVERCGDEGRGMRILYGGSVKPDNARELMAVADVNGALVGGASLKAGDFLAIIAACAP